MRNLIGRADEAHPPLKDAKTFDTGCLLAAFKKELESHADAKKGVPFSTMRKMASSRPDAARWSMQSPKAPTPGRMTRGASRMVFRHW